MTIVSSSSIRPRWTFLTISMLLGLQLSFIGFIQLKQHERMLTIIDWTFFTRSQLQSDDNLMNSNKTIMGLPLIEPDFNVTSVSMDNISQPMKDHPHAGAIDEEGRYGYVHDPTVIANSKIPFSIPSEELRQVCAPAGAGPEGIGGYRLLTEKVRVSNIHSSLKIFCSVYTSPANDLVRWAIAETWGGHCDGYMAATLYSEVESGTVHIPHLGEEAYGNMWQKVRSMWSYVHDNFIDSYDFFHIGGDDTFVIVENMRSFLQGEKVKEDAGGSSYPLPLYIGFPVGNKNNYFNGGGSGYTLNKAALRLLVQEAFPTCFPFETVSAEDRFVGNCLRKFNIKGYDTRDATGELRYNNDPQFIYYLNFSDPLFMEGNWVAQYLVGMTQDWPLKSGLEGASNETVSFHHIKTPAKIRRVYKILYRKNTPDCSTDGQNEPGKIMPEEYYTSLPHNNCSWNYNSGSYQTCPFELYTEYIKDV